MPAKDSGRSDILYLRQLPYGPAVRIRRTSDDGATPIIAVLDVDRRYGTPREQELGEPPPLMRVEGATEADVLAQLEPVAREDAAIVRLMREKGQR